MSIYKGEFQTDTADILYPHTTYDCVFMEDGKTLQQRVSEGFKANGGNADTIGGKKPSDFITIENEVLNGFSKLGLTDSDFSDTDFASNINKIITKMLSIKYYKELRYYLWNGTEYANLLNSIKTNCPVVSIEYGIKIECMSSINTPNKVTVYPNTSNGLVRELWGYYDNAWGGFNEIEKVGHNHGLELKSGIISETDTIEKIITSQPDKSIGVYDLPKINSEFPNYVGTVFIVKYSEYRAQLYFTVNTISILYYGVYHGTDIPKFKGWKNANDAFTLEGKRASEFMLKNQTYITGADYNTLTDKGLYEVIGTTASPLKNYPFSATGNEYVFVLKRGETYMKQIAFNVRNSQQKTRTMAGGVWGNWVNDSSTLEGKSASEFALASHTHTFPVTSVAGRTGAVTLTKADVGLGNIPNAVSSSVTSTSTTTLANSAAVKTAYDRAEQAFQSASSGKTAIASAITAKGVAASGSDTFATLANKISQIKTETARSITVNVYYTKTKEFYDYLWSVSSNVVADILNVYQLSLSMFKDYMKFVGTFNPTDTGNVGHIYRYQYGYTTTVANEIIIIELVNSTGAFTMYSGIAYPKPKQTANAIVYAVNSPGRFYAASDKSYQYRVWTSNK